MFKASKRKMIIIMLTFGAAIFSQIVSAQENGFKLCTVTSDSRIVAVKSDESCSPFCGEHHLTFELDQPTFVAVRVTTPMGVLVRQLAAQVLNAGEHTFAWDGSDDRGADAGSGIYVYSIQAVEPSVNVLALSH